jgi:hypothetical protein
VAARLSREVAAMERLRAAFESEARARAEAPAGLDRLQLPSLAKA